jgi:pimeloyl-ACP methyl ester carboxylesterase
MTEPRLSFVQCLDAGGLHRMAYWEWGARDNPRVLVCAHGLSRQGRDFDTLARALCGEYRVVCPDVVGRGRSDRLRDPNGYQIPAYVADMVTLLARLDVPTVHWVGTSMGGLIGMLLAAQAGTPITRLVLNDVGPTMQFDALQRIGTYLGVPQRWASVEEAADFLRSISTGFGPHTREEWLALSRPMVVHSEGEGGHDPHYVLHYDPDIAVPFRSITRASAAAGEAVLWASYDRIVCPTLLLRGADSDLLSEATALAMAQRGPRARLHRFAGVGHAPTLVAAEQIDVVKDFLLAP